MTETNPIKKIVELDAPTYKNSKTVTTLANVNLTLWDIVKTGLAGRLNLGLLGEAGMGKSQLIADIRSLTGNNASRVLGRNDLDIKSLFRQMDMTPLAQAMKKGGTVAQRDISKVTDEVYKPLTIVEEINRCAEAVQNQFFNIFEGFIEIDGKEYSLGGTELKQFSDIDGTEWKQNVTYSVGVWSANFGNGQYSGTVSMDKALKERSHLMIDVDNFSPKGNNLDAILLGSGGEVRLKDQEKPKDRTKLFTEAFSYLKQKSYTPDQMELGQELLLFRYLVLGLDHIPCEAADNSKRIMKGIWPAKAEEDDIGNDDEKYLYRMTFPASVRGAMTIMSLARALREYVRVKDQNANPSVIDSVVESFKLVGAYSGMIRNTQRIREEFVDNPYRAAAKVGKVMKANLGTKKDLMEAIAYKKSVDEPFTQEMLGECRGEYACFKD